MKNITILVVLSIAVLFIGCYADIKGVSATSTCTYTKTTTENINYSGQMKHQRTAHEAFLLNNNKVLLIGKPTECDATELYSSELYDIAAGTFAYAENRNCTRTTTSVMLNNNKILVMAGQYCDVEIYHPETDTFEKIGRENRNRSGFTLTLLNDGNVLVAGGSGKTGVVLDGLEVNTSLKTAALYMANSNTFVDTGNTNTTRTGHTATLLADGKVLIAGGYLFDTSATGTDHGYRFRLQAEIYDPATGEFTTTGSLTHARRYHTATLLNDNRVLIVGGRSSETLYNPNFFYSWASFKAVTTAEIYDPTTETFTVVSSEMKQPHAGHTATLLQNGKVLIVGGTGNECTYTSEMELFDPTTETFEYLGANLTDRDNHTATLLPDGRVLITGGSTTSQSLNTSEIYTPE